MGRWKSSRLSERLVKRLQDLGVRFELDSVNYGIIRDDRGIQLGVVHGMDYATWWLGDITYPSGPISPMVWDEGLGKLVSTTIDGSFPVSQLVRRDYPLEVCRAYSRMFVT